MSETTIDSEKNPVSPYSHTKALVTEFDLAIERSGSTKGHHLKIPDRAGATAAYRV